MNKSQDVINYLIDRFKYTTFLEIGVRNNEGKLSIDHIKCDEKDGVDIMPSLANYTMSSDQFFDTIPIEQTYDIIYVDGDHKKSQVMKDIENSFKHLNPGGTIVCHDINPPSERHLATRYCNDCWEVWVELRSTRADLEMYALNIDMGPGIIRKGTQELYTDEIEYTWNYLDSNRKKLLNEISIDEFRSIFGEKK